MFFGGKMTISRNGVGIICGEVVPASEVELLWTLSEIEKPIICRVLVSLHQRRTNVLHTEATFYSLLRRLHEKGLVSREKLRISVQGATLQRVFWSTTDAVREYFIEHKKRSGGSG
jgi:hypothetical protein